MWSSVEKRLASKNGGSNVVHEVIPNAKLSVTAAMADTMTNGSYRGHWVADLIAGS